MGRACRSLKCALTVFSLFALLPGAVVGQGARPAPTQTTAAAAAAQVVMPEAERIVLLLRTSLLTLNDALQTGNFTVLRDVSAPSFREANSAARLSEIFGNLARQNIDLGAVAILTPQLSEPPILDTNANMLRMKGFFPSQPLRLDFEVVYQAVAGRWRLFGLSVQPTLAAPLAAAAPIAPTALEPLPKKKVEPAKMEVLKK